jgi:hypothetical protein
MDVAKRKRQTRVQTRKVKSTERRSGAKMLDDATKGWTVVRILGYLTGRCNGRREYYDAVAGYTTEREMMVICMLCLRSESMTDVCLYHPEPQAQPLHPCSWLLGMLYCTWLCLAVPTSKRLSPEKAHHLTRSRLGRKCWRMDLPCGSGGRRPSWLSTVRPVSLLADLTPNLNAPSHG